MGAGPLGLIPDPPGVPSLSPSAAPAGWGEDAPIRVRYLGGFSFTNSRRPTDPWKPSRIRTLFSYLLINRNKVVLKEKLHSLLWPTTLYDSDASGLKVTVHALRKALEMRAGDTPDAFDLRYEDYGYVLHTGGAVWVDVDEFEALTNQTRIAEACHEVTTVDELCERAATLYRGDFLAGETGEWVTEQREWLRSIALRVMHLLTRNAMSRGDSSAATTYCRRTLEVDPCDEETYRTLMLVHARRGELGQVKRWHELCTRRLSEHLEIAPAEATDRLLHRVLGSRLADSAP